MATRVLTRHEQVRLAISHGDDVTQDVFTELAEHRRIIEGPQLGDLTVIDDKANDEGHLMARLRLQLNQRSQRLGRRSTARQNRETRYESLAGGAHMLDPSDAIIRQHDVTALRHALNRLSASERHLIIARHIEERSWNQIAEELGKSSCAVRQAGRRALNNLAALFDNTETRTTPPAESVDASRGVSPYCGVDSRFNETVIDESLVQQFLAEAAAHSSHGSIASADPLR